MAWADNCVRSHVNHIEWCDGGIMIYFTNSKVYQEGVKFNKPWNIYLDPLCPEICPVLDLDNDVLVYPTFLKGGFFLFPGYLQYNRFMRIFCNF